MIRFLVLAGGLAFLASCQQTPTPPPLKLEPSATSVGFGRVPVGADSTPKRLTFKLNRPGTARMSYPANPFTGTHKSEFNISPISLARTPVGQQSPVTVAMNCRPDGLGRREAKLSPTVAGAATEIVKLSCIGVGKTPNQRGANVKIYNGSGSPDGALEFGTLQVGAMATRTVRIVNRTAGTLDIRIRWIVGPRSTRAGFRVPVGSGIDMVANPAPFGNPPKQIGPGQTITVQIRFKPHQDDFYDASLEVQLDQPGTRNNTQLLYTYVTGTGGRGPG